jgi:hypothetical protein
MPDTTVATALTRLSVASAGERELHRPPWRVGFPN